MSFSNCPAGFKALSKFCAKTAVTRVVYEATGAYHGGLERASLRANKSETNDWLKFTLEGVGARTHGYAFTDTAFARYWV